MLLSLAAQRSPLSSALLLGPSRRPFRRSLYALWLCTAGRLPAPHPPLDCLPGEEGAVVGLTTTAVEAGAERAWSLVKLIAADRQLAGTERRVRDGL
jgi:hypothetical protein